MEMPLEYDSPYRYAFHSHALEGAILDYVNVSTSSYVVDVGDLYAGSSVPGSSDGQPASGSDEAAFQSFDPGSDVGLTGQEQSPSRLLTQGTNPKITDEESFALSIDDYCFQAEQNLLEYTGLTSASHFAFCAASDPPTEHPGEESFSSSSSSVRSYNFQVLTWY
jgi:hypothetical protein